MDGRTQQGAPCYVLYIHTMAPQMVSTAISNVSTKLQQQQTKPNTAKRVRNCGQLCGGGKKSRVRPVLPLMPKRGVTPLTLARVR